jgi:hypothetical protein
MKQQADMPPISPARRAIAEGRATMADHAEAVLIDDLRLFVGNLGNSELRRLWLQECRKTFSSGKLHEHSHRKEFLENLLTTLSDSRLGAFSTPKPVLNHVRLTFMETLERIKRNDDLYPHPAPR